MGYLLDTNIVSAFLKRNLTLNQKFREVVAQEQEVFISCISYYEIRRGLLAVNATRQMANFELFLQLVHILLLDDLDILEQAAVIYASLKQKGRLIQDADILIAATAIAKGLILVSNDSDLSRVEGVGLENWLLEE
ncbi:MAG: type II toxin-antitoxin system VapC family toxin [Symploca sp. SIO2E6]|nr:type II toxin-antitoxin system VapC family toxin [Symploca sp. SIO2E6]